MTTFRRPAMDDKPIEGFREASRHRAIDNSNAINVAAPEDNYNQPVRVSRSYKRMQLAPSLASTKTD